MEMFVPPQGSTSLTDKAKEREAGDPRLTELFYSRTDVSNKNNQDVDFVERNNVGVLNTTNQEFERSIGVLNTTNQQFARSIAVLNKTNEDFERSIGVFNTGILNKTSQDLERSIEVLSTTNQDLERNGVHVAERNGQQS